MYKTSYQNLVCIQTVFSAYRTQLTGKQSAPLERAIHSGMNQHYYFRYIYNVFVHDFCLSIEWHWMTLKYIRTGMYVYACRTYEQTVRNTRLSWRCGTSKVWFGFLGEGRKRNQISVGSCSEVTFPGKVTDADLRALNASICAPSGLEEPCFLKRLPNGNIGISFTPREIGDHVCTKYRFVGLCWYVQPYIL